MLRALMGASLLSLLLLTQPGPLRAQSLAGIWQGVEKNPDENERYWPAVLRLQPTKSGQLFGVIYEEVGGNPGITSTFQVRATPAAGGLRLEHGRQLSETGRTPFSYWCHGYIQFSYDAAEEKLTGHATYDPTGDCSVGTYVLYRVRLKSAPTVPAATLTTLRVSGRDVRWYADAALKQPLATGNTYRTKLSKTTTFYITQGYYATSQGAVVPVTVKVQGAPPRPPQPAPRPVPPPALPAPPADTARLDTVRRAPLPALAATPVVLPTVLFRLGTAELLPEARPALAQLAAELRSRPTLRLRIIGHTDRVGEPQKNQVLSEQRAEAVKQQLVQAGIGADRLSTAGYGDTRPLHPSPDARNRRVEVQVVE